MSMNSNYSMPRALRWPGRAGTILWVCFGAWLASGCEMTGDYRPDAVGKDGLLTVVLDSSHWNGPVGEAVQNYVAPYIATLPGSERQFELRVMDISKRFEEITAQKNVLIVGALSDTTAEARFLKSRLPEGGADVLQDRSGIVVERPNLWRRNQMVVYVMASTPQKLIETLQEKGRDVRYVYNQVLRSRLEQNMFEKGRQEPVEEQLMEKHGFAVNVQHDYFVAVDTTNFVWLRRVLSDTWRSFFIHYIEDANPAALDPEWIYSVQDSLLQTYIQGTLGGFVQIDRRRPLETENINFLGRYGFETRGLWHMVQPREDGTLAEFGMGGPFVSYAFYDEPSGRIYLMNGLVFAPGHDKREFVRQLEVVAHTFRTRAEAARPEGQVAAGL